MKHSYQIRASATSQAHADRQLNGRSDQMHQSNGLVLPLAQQSQHQLTAVLIFLVTKINILCKLLDEALPTCPSLQIYVSGKVVLSYLQYIARKSRPESKYLRL